MHQREAAYGDGTPGACPHPSDPLAARLVIPASIHHLWFRVLVRWQVPVQRRVNDIQVNSSGLLAVTATTERAGRSAQADVGETVGVSAEDQVIDVRTAAESSNLLDELPELRVDDRDDDEPVLMRADGRPVDTWRERYPYSERMGREEYERTRRLLQIEEAGRIPGSACFSARWRRSAG
jgi:hypothetical protein